MQVEIIIAAIIEGIITLIVGFWGGYTVGINKKILDNVRQRNTFNNYIFLEVIDF